MAKILIIEDYESLQKIYRKIIGNAGHTVLVASNGEEGLKLANENKVDFARYFDARNWRFGISRGI